MFRTSRYTLFLCSARLLQWPNSALLPLNRQLQQAIFEELCSGPFSYLQSRRITTLICVLHGLLSLAGMEVSDSWIHA